jgi:hypothetical protein
LQNGEPRSAAVADQLARGARLYALGCATAECHGKHGEGVRSGGTFRVWPLVGAEFQARNPNAQVIFDVVRSGSERRLRAMTDQQIYDAIAHELSHAAHDWRRASVKWASSGPAWTIDGARCATRRRSLQTMLTDADWSEALAASTRRPVSRKAPRKQTRETTRKAAPKTKP